jgi:hypothetical protein
METLQKSKKETQKHIAEIFEHDISWWVYDNKVKELDDSTIEHIESYIAKGFTSGELCIYYGKNYDKEANGWWTLIDWKDIALALYNAIGNKTKEEEAKKLFNETWKQYLNQ